MRINKFFAAALAATTLLASCAKDENGVIEAEGQETFAGFTITIPMAPAGTRAGEDAALATTAENDIKNVAVFVVGTSTVDKLYLDNPATDFEFVGGVATAKRAVLTTTGTKNIFVVTNYTAALKTAIDNMGVGAFGPNAIALDETNFMTMNGANLESLTMTGKKLSQTLTAATNTEPLAVATPIAVDVYRNLAKVVVRFDNEYTAPIGGTHAANSVKFGLIAKAKGAWLDNTENDGATATAFTTVPTAAKTDANDAYWANFSERELGVANTAKWKEVSAKAAAPTPAMPGWYAHENIYGTDGLLNGRTTIARICGTFIPTDLVATYNATTGARTLSHPSTAASFYRLNDGSYWSEAAYATATTADPMTAPFAIAASSFGAKYDGGVGYYNITVMDDTRKPIVQRNNYYDLAIETINGPGSPTEEEGDPTTPLETESYVSVKVTVKPWYRQSTGHDLQ